MRYRSARRGESAHPLLARCLTGFLSLQGSSAYPTHLKSIHLGLVFFTTLAVVGFFSLLEVDPHHDGIMLKPAVDVANGKMLFRDTFSQYGALTIFVQALAVKIFGTKLIVIRLLTVLFYGLIAVLQWLIYSRLLPMRVNTLSWVIWLSLGYFFIDYETMVLVPSATVFPICTVLLSVYLLILHIESHKRMHIVMAGVATACTFWLKSNFGMAHFASMVLLVTLLSVLGTGKDQLRDVGGFLTGYALVHFGFVLWLFKNQLFKDFWIQTVEFGYLFALNDEGPMHAPFLARLVNCLFQVESKHAFISVLWTLMPAVSALLCCCMLYVLFKKRSLRLTENVLLAASTTSTALWLTYFPVNSVYHMYLSSVLSLGTFVYLLWGITQLFPVKGRLVARLLCTILVFYPDVSMRSYGFVKKVERFSAYEKIESPAFLRGIYVPPREAQVYRTINATVKHYPDYSLINLTRDGLYSLYNEKNKEFHKMYLDWGWINTALYPGYSRRLREEMAGRRAMILSDDIAFIEGYVPVAAFPGIGKGELKSNVILHIPGEPGNGFEIVRVGPVPELDGVSIRKRYPLIRIAATSAEPLSINSFVVRVYEEDVGYHKQNPSEFAYDLFAASTNREREEYLKEWFHMDDRYAIHGKHSWYADPSMARILDAASGRVLVEKYSFAANSMGGKGVKRIAVVQNGKARLRKEDDLLDLQCSEGSAVDIMPFIRLSEQYIIKLRINFNRSRYYETTIVSSDLRGDVSEGKFGMSEIADDHANQ